MVPNEADCGANLPILTRATGVARGRSVLRLQDRVAEMRGDSCGSAGQGSCGRARPGWPVNAPAVLRCAPVQDDTAPAGGLPGSSRPFRACPHGQTYVEQAILGLLSFVPY